MGALLLLCMVEWLELRPIFLMNEATRANFSFGNCRSGWWIKVVIESNSKERFLGQFVVFPPVPEK